MDDSSPLRPASFLELDEALIRLRRLWAAGTPRLGTSADPHRQVEMSTVLVADCVDRLTRGGASAQPTEANVAAVAQGLDVAPSTASRLVDRAVDAGVVERSVSLVDPRRVRLALTETGADLVARAASFRMSYLSTLLAGWTVSDVDTLAHLLGRFAGRVREHPPPVAADPAIATHPPKENPT